MPSTYFIIDFAYNPASTKPLAIFELGDAFYSEYPEKKMGAKQLTPAQYLEFDIKNQHKDPVFIQVTPSGLEIKSLNDNKLIYTSDKENPSNFITELCDSYGTINNLLLNIFSNAGQNTEGRELIFHLAEPKLYGNYDWVEENGSQVKLLNHSSSTLKDAFYNKATLAKFANGSPIFPGTLIIPGGTEIDESAIDRFLEEHKSEYYVIKPAVGTHARNVHVVLANQLKKVLKDNKNHEWHGFVVQVCHLSKQLKYNKEYYYAKSRAIVRVDFLPSSCVPKISIVTAFWQLANKPAKDLLDDKNVIANMDANQEGVLEINEEDLHHITQEFIRHLPDIIKKMQSNDMPKIKSRAMDAPDPAKLAEALHSFIDAQSINCSYNDNTFDKNLSRVKHFVIDILGLKREFHDWVNYSNDSEQEFIKNATILFCGNKKTTVNHISIVSMFKQQAPNIIIATVLITASMLLLSDPNSNSSFNLKLVTGAVLTTISSLIVGVLGHPAIVRASQSFFKTGEHQNTETISRSCSDLRL